MTPLGLKMRSDHGTLATQSLKVFKKSKAYLPNLAQSSHVIRHRRGVNRLELLWFVEIIRRNGLTRSVLGLSQMSIGWSGLRPCPWMEIR